jgi:hypothetical protein
MTDAYKQFGEVLLRVTRKTSKDPDAGLKLKDAILTMGPGCIFDDLKTDDELKGGQRLLEWIEQHLDNQEG